MEAATLAVEGRTFTGSIPGRSNEQRRDALARANAIRSYRAGVKLEIKRGMMSKADVASLVVDPPEMMSSMKIADLLHCVPKLGRVKVNRMLVKAQCSHSKTLGGLSERQRSELLSALLSG